MVLLVALNKQPTFVANRDSQALEGFLHTHTELKVEVVYVKFNETLLSNTHL